MFQTMNNAAAAYTKVGRDIGAETASPHKLILMLFDGALVALGAAAMQIDAGDKAAMSESITKACNIIDQGLRDSTDPTAGGDMAARLIALYTYMTERLQFANIKCDKAIIEEVSGLLRELRSAWEEIASDPAVVSNSRKVA